MPTWVIVAIVIAVILAVLFVVWMARNGVADGADAIGDIFEVIGDILGALHH